MATGGRVYTFASSSIAGSTTGSTQTYVFPIAGQVWKITAGAEPVGTLGTVAIGYLDLFRLQIQRQTGDFINSAKAPGYSLFGLQDAAWYPKPSILLGASETLTFYIDNRSVSAITVYLNFHMVEMRG